MKMVLTDKFDYDISKINKDLVKIIKYNKTNTILGEFTSPIHSYTKYLDGRILKQRGRIEEGIVYAKIKPTTKNHWDVSRDVWYEVLYETEYEIKIINNLEQSKMYLSCYFDFKVEKY